MFENATTGELIDALRPLLDTGRISGLIKVDSVQVLDSEADEVFEEVFTQYDSYGFSSPDEYGCVQLRDVNDLVADWKENGNEFEKRIAAATPQWYGIIIKDHVYPDAVDINLRANTQGQWLFAWGIEEEIYFDQFRMFNEHWMHKVTGELKWTLTRQERNSREYRRNPEYSKGPVVPNHATVGAGNNAFPGDPDWEQFAMEVAEYKIKDMIKRAERAEKVASQGGGKRPTVGPT